MFQNGREVLQYTQPIDILIMGIYMERLDGIAVKDCLQQRQEGPYILFVTDYEGCMRRAFGNRVLGFVRKQDIGKKLPEFLQQAFRLLGRGIMIEGRYRSTEIYAIQAMKEYTKLYLRNGHSPSVRISLVKWEAKLKGEMFLRVHRAWLVNLCYVEKIEKGRMVVWGEDIPISVRRQKRVKEVYFEYLKRYMGGGNVDI